MTTSQTIIDTPKPQFGLHQLHALARFIDHTTWTPDALSGAEAEAEAIDDLFEDLNDYLTTTNGVMVEAVPSSPLVMSEPDLLLEVLVVPFDAPAQPGENDQLGE